MDLKIKFGSPAKAAVPRVRQVSDALARRVKKAKTLDELGAPERLQPRHAFRAERSLGSQDLFGEQGGQPLGDRIAVNGVVNSLGWLLPQPLQRCFGFLRQAGFGGAFGEVL